MAATLTTTELAAELGCDTRTTRKFLRDQLGDGKAVVGKGSRYAIEKAKVRSLKSQFAKWEKAREAAKADKGDDADNTPEEVTEDE